MNQFIRLRFVSASAIISHKLGIKWTTKKTVRIEDYVDKNGLRERTVTQVSARQ